MILDNAELKKIITKPRYGDKLKEIKTYSDKALMHVKGVGLDPYIERISQFEPKDLINTRKKYAVSNKDLFARLLRPLDKVFSAKGGSAYYNLAGEAEKKISERLTDAGHGYSIKKWLQIFWLPAMAYDPMGLIFMEVDAEGNTYPTYKAVNDVFDYLPKGRKLEYVIFNKDHRIDELVREGKGTKDSLYRVVDDVSDRIVKVTNEEVYEFTDLSYPNYFLEVPARIISDIYDPVKGFYVSSIDDLIEKADQFLLQGSVKNIFKNYFGFPQHWTYQSACPECKGTKVLGGSECTHCKGTGLKQRTDPSETIYLPVPQTKDQPILAPNVGGFVSPDIEGWDKMDGELKMLENCMFQTMWGTHQQEEADNQTATGKFIDVQPVNDRLYCFSESAEVMETFVVDKIGANLLGATYKGASITYGRRYMIETPDELWKKYEDARKSGAPSAALDDLYSDYLQARYVANTLELRKYTVLAKIEPYKHFSLGDLKGMPGEMANKKLLFADWVQTKDDSEILGNIDTLRADFEKYCEEHEMEEEEEGEGYPEGGAEVKKKTVPEN